VELFAEWNEPSDKEKKKALDANNSWVSKNWKNLLIMRLENEI
jgi:hypothetical protein